MSRILILSNGHGEDLSGSLLARSLERRGHVVNALPIVGRGKDYIREEIKIINKTKEFKTGGLGYNTLKGRLDDLFNGQIIYLIRNLLLTYSVRKNYDFFIVVGDIIPISFAWVVKKRFFVYLVAYSSHYEGKLNLPWPCKFFLKSENVIRIYARDLLTSIDLTGQLKRKVKFLGNPFMDTLSISKEKSKIIFKILLLPGSRIPELINNFYLMLDLLENISYIKYFKDIEFNFGLINDLKRDKVLEILRIRNWQHNKQSSLPNRMKLRYKFINVKFIWNSFAEILNSSDLVISMSGTAAEQAVGLGKPIIQLEGEGPQFTKTFAEAQRRLLGKYIFCATKFNNKTQQINQTIKLIIKIIYLIKLDNRFLKSCNQNGKNRIGGIGATNNIVFDIENFKDNYD